MGSYMPPDVRASNILRELEIIKPPIPVEDICRHYNIKVILDADIESGLVPLDAWSYDDRYYNDLYEESLFMPILNSTITVLRIPYDEFEEGYDGWKD